MKITYELRACCLDCTHADYAINGDLIVGDCFTFLCRHADICRLWDAAGSSSPAADMQASPVLSPDKAPQLLSSPPDDGEGGLTPPPSLSDRGKVSDSDTPEDLIDETSSDDGTDGSPEPESAMRPYYLTPAAHPEAPRRLSPDTGASGAPRPQKLYYYVRCEKCGYDANLPGPPDLAEHTCRKCGYVTPLSDLTRAKAFCKCGKQLQWLTNINSFAIERRCPTCSSPLSLWYNSKLGEYTDGTLPKSKKKRGGGIKSGKSNKL